MADDPTIVRNPTLTLNVLSEEQYQSIPIPSDQEIYLTPDDTDEKLAGKQNKLVEGNNISLVDNVDGTTTISSTASESFFRGPFTTWTNVPATGSEANYLIDIHGSHIPQPTDFITIANTSDYVSSEPLGTVIAYMNSTSLVTSVNGVTEVTHRAIDGEYYIDEPTSGEHIFRVVSQTRFASAMHQLYAAKTIVYNGNTYTVGDLVKSFDRSESSGDQRSTFNYYAIYSGAWRFYYDVNAVWDTDGKAGWKPQYQIENVLPIASSTEPGIAKLYTATGQNTDGSMTQKSITDALDSKLTTTDEASKVYGTNDQGEQVRYDVNDFGQIDNVAIHGIDQTITNKRVDLKVVEQENSLPTASEDLLGRIVQYTGTTTQDYTHGHFYECKVSGAPSEAVCTATDSSTLYPYHITIDKDTFETQITTSGEYVFNYDGINWTLNGTAVDLADYGISIQEGITYSSGDNMYIQYTESTIGYFWSPMPVQTSTVFRRIVEE